MARKKTEDEIDSSDNRIVSFRAPDAIHGALKKIVAHLEMTSIRFDGKQPSGQDLMIWLISDIYMGGEDNWPERIADAYKQYAKFKDKFGS